MPKFLSDLDILAPELTITSNGANKPLLTLESTDDSTENQPEIKFYKNSASDASEDIGIITWRALDNGGTSTVYARILGEVEANTNTSELGKLSLQARNESSYLDGIVIEGTATSGEIDVTIANGAASTTTIAGKAVIPSRVYSQPGSATLGAHSAGDVWYFGNTGTTKGKIYYLNDSATWTIANADAEVDATGMLAVALGDNSTDDGMLLRGMVTLYEINGTEDHGKKLFLHTADGEVSVTAPSANGHFVRIIGYSLGDTSTNSDEVYFNPDNTFVEVSA
jgi:hypothetical protein